MHARGRASVIFGAHARGRHGGMQAHFELDQRATQALGACAQLQSDQADVTLQVARAPITDFAARWRTDSRWAVCDGVRCATVCGVRGIWVVLSARRRQHLDTVRHDQQMRQRCVEPYWRSLQAFRRDTIRARTAPRCTMAVGEGY